MMRALIFLLMLTGPAMAAELTGTAAYRERIAMPPEARFIARLYDLSGPVPRVLGRFERGGSDGPPYAFALDLPDGVDPAGLALRTEVLVGGRVFFQATSRLDGPVAQGGGLAPVTMRRATGEEATPLIGTLWRIESLDGALLPHLEGRPEPTFQLDEAGGFSASVGCNRLGGQYRMADGGIAMARGLSTMMACPEPLDTLEGQLLDAIDEARDASVTGQTLVLRDAAGRERAVLSALVFPGR